MHGATTNTAVIPYDITYGTYGNIPIALYIQIIAFHERLLM